MQVNEVCKQTGLTKKAIEYYQLKGLVSPGISENGYREFSESDLSRLKEIALFRKLDLSTDEIIQVLDSNDRKQTLLLIKRVAEIRTNTKLHRLSLIGKLINGADVSEIHDGLSLLDQQATIKEKLLIAFPGYFGRYISIHFGQFLNKPIVTKEQKLLFENIVDFLDNMETFEISEEIQAILDEVDKHMDEEKIEGVNNNIQNAYNDFETYWKSNKDKIMEYMEYRKTDEYQNLAVAKFAESFRKFGETSGYYDVFIPMMRKLSTEYDTYCKKMLDANEKLMRKMQE